MQVFDKDWFAEHQKALRWFANTYVGRHVFGLQNTPGHVIKITPSAHFLIDWKDAQKGTTKIKANYCTSPIHGVQLFQKFNLIWKAMHWFDDLFLEKQKLIPNFGFSSLYKYTPAAGTGPYSGSALGREIHGGTWSEIRTNAFDNLFSDQTVSMGMTTQNTQDRFEVFSRVIFMFDTTESVLNFGKRLSASFKLALDLHVQTPTKEFWSSADDGIRIAGLEAAPVLADYISVGDFDNLGSDAFASKTQSQIGTLPTVVTFDFNQTGIDYIKYNESTYIGVKYLQDTNYDPDTSVEPTWYSYAVNNWIMQTRFDFIGDIAPELKIEVDGPLFVNVGDVWKSMDRSIESGLQINIGDAWKDIQNMFINIGDVWKQIL